MGKYPESWTASEKHYHNTGEIVCPVCFKYYDETLAATDENGNQVCPVCVEEMECHWCGTLTSELVPHDGERVCKECKKCLIES